MKKRVAALALSTVAALSPALGLAATLDAASQGEAPAIARSFVTFWAAARDKPFPEQQALWNRFIEAPREVLYRSVVWEIRDNPDWRQLKERTLRNRFAAYPRISGEIPGEAEAIETAIGVQTARFGGYFGSSWQPHVVVVLAPNFDAKSGVLPDGRPILALAVDSLVLEKARLDILLPHEFFHLWDAEQSGISNDGVMPGTHLTLPLFAEGLATYASTVVSPGYTDGEYLLQDDLGALPDASLLATAKRFLADAGDMTIDPVQHKTSKAFRRWFQAGRTQFQAGLPNRAGYWLGLHVIRVLRRSHSLHEIASWSPSQAQAETLAALREMAGGSAR
jgi:hypothetical protein